MFVCGYRAMGPVDAAALVWSRGGAEVQPAIVADGSFAAAVGQGPRLLRPLLARHRRLIGVGDVRLDDRAAVARMAGLHSPGGASDLALVLAAIDACGERAVGELIGDFAFVVWDPGAHKLIAARDAFGVRTLYQRQVGDLLLFSDRIDALRPSGDWDLEYFADYLTGMVAPGTRTPWRDVQCVVPGGFVLARGSVSTERRYWSAHTFEPVERDPGAVDRFRSLFEEAVRTRMGGPGQTWAQLSGGVDSSSIVAVAHDSGLSGTITSVDTLGRGDERRFIEPVLRRFRVRNEQVIDHWPWQGDEGPAPITEQPGVLYPFFARERRMHTVLRSAGARVLLCGIGSDHYLSGSLDYIADMAASGRWRAALGELADWSVARRTSFWKLARAQLLRRRPDASLPGWMETGFAARTNAAARVREERDALIGAGRRFATPIAEGLDAIHVWLHRWPYGEDIEVRYPFLYRPLVEASLRLAPELRIRPHGGNKWVLREAMRGRLPEEVRTRNGKGSIDDRILWSFAHERARLDALLANPILAELGCVRPDALRTAVELARNGRRQNMLPLMNVLSLETWLAVRAGTWQPSRHAAPSAA